MHMRVLPATAIAVLVVGLAATTVTGISASPAPAAASRHHVAAAAATRSSRPGTADWQKIKTAARLRRTALAPHRTAHFRAFAASLGLGELVTIHPLSPGRCRTAVIDLYNNLLDLEHAYPGESWNPLRRAVAKEPSISACAPRPPKQHAA
jgi:hypothetical protein